MTDLLERARAARSGLDNGRAPGPHLAATSVATAPTDRLWMGDVGEALPHTPDLPANTSRIRPLQPVRSPAEPLHPYLAGLVQQLFIVPDGTERAIRSVVFASVDGSRESSLLSAAVAEILAARVSGPIGLVDANFQAPSLHRYYGVNNAVGLVDALSSTEPVRSYAQQLGSGHQGSLWLLPPGVSADADGLLMAEPSRRRVRSLLGAFDYVVIEAPPVNRSRAASILAAHVDGVVLIAEANVTRRHAVCAAADTLRASGARVLGTVLNNRTFPIPNVVYKQL